MIKRIFEKILLSSRWLLTPFYLALLFTLLALLGKVGVRVFDLATRFIGLGEEDVILAALAVVDLTLSASLIIIVVFSGYANFVSRLDGADSAAWPSWVAHIDFSELKVKLMSSIVAISAIKLLEAFMNASHETDRDLAWQTGIHIAFVVSTLLVAFADRLGDHPKPADP